MAANPNDPAHLVRAWWDSTLNNDQRRNAQWASLRKIVGDQKYRYAMLKLYYGMYLGRDPVGLSPTGYAQSSPLAPQDSLRYNVVQSVIDTKLAKLAKNTPRTRFLTTGGDWSAQKKSKRLTQFVDGERYRLAQAPKDRKVKLHASLFGLGRLHIFEGEDNKVATEWVFPGEIRVDDQDGMFGQPRSQHREKQVAKELLLRKYAAGGDGGNNRAHILSAPLLTPLGNKLTSSQEQSLCTVVESWHLPGLEAESQTEADSESKATKKAEKAVETTPNNGRHILSIEGATFDDSDYEEDDYPFVDLRFGNTPLGYWGRGDAEDLKPIQRELTRSLMRLQEILFLCAAPKVLLEMGSKVNKKHIRNMVGDIIEYVGKPPELWVADGVPPGLVQHIQWLIQSAYQQVGLQAMDAQGTKPEGLDSEPSLREYHDIGSERFMEMGKAVEEYHLNCDRKIIATAARIAERNGGHYIVQAPGRQSWDEVDWKEINLDADEYIMQAYPVSMLSHTVAGRLAEVKDLMDLGMVDQNTGYKLMDFPDLESVNSLELAAVNDIDRVIERVLDEGKWEQPDSLQNLIYGVRMMHLAYLRARQDGAPESHLELARQWIDAAQAILDEAAMANQPPAPGVGAQPSAGAPPPAAPPPGGGMGPSDLGGPGSVLPS